MFGGPRAFMDRSGGGLGTPSGRSRAVVGPSGWSFGRPWESLGDVLGYFLLNICVRGGLWNDIVDFLGNDIPYNTFTMF